MWKWIKAIFVILLVYMLEKAIMPSEATPPLDILNRKCEVVINEVFGNIFEASPDSFIELRGVCSSGTPNELPLSSKKLIIVHKTAIIGIINLQNHKMNTNGYFVIGGQHLVQKSLDWRHTDIKMRSLLLPSATVSTFLNKPTGRPFAVALLSKKDAKDTRLTQITISYKEKKEVELKLTPALKVIIKDHVDDAVVIGSTNEMACDTFNSLFNQFEGTPDYIMPNIIELRYPEEQPSRARHRRHRHHHGNGNHVRGNTTFILSRSRRAPALPKGSKGKADPKQQDIRNMFQGRVTGSGSSAATSNANRGVSPLCTRVAAVQPSTPESSSSSISSSSNRSPQRSRGEGEHESLPFDNDLVHEEIEREQRLQASLLHLHTHSQSQSHPRPEPETPPPSNHDAALRAASLSRCTDLLDSFLPRSFRISLPSPLTENLCDSAIPINPELEAELQVAAYPIITGEIENNAEASGSCTRNPLPIHKAINTIFTYKSHYEDYAVPSMLTLRDQGVRDDLLAAPDCEMIAAFQQQLLPTTQKTQEQRLDDNWKRIIKHFTDHPNARVPLQYIKDHKNDFMEWLELTESTNPVNIKLRCKLCNSYAKSGNNRLSAQSKPAVAYDDGYMGSASQITRDYLKQHPASSWHRDILDMEQQAKKQAFEKSNAIAVLREYQKLTPQQQSTSRIALMIYYQAKHNIAFQAHEGMVNMVELLGVDMGGKEGLHRNKHSVKSFVDIIAKDLHSHLINHIYKTKCNFSLILDTAIDRQGNDFLVMLLQALETDNPTVYMYALVPVGIDGRAEAYRDLIEETMKKDIIHPARRDSPEYTFLDVAKSQMSGIVTDGAAVFSGHTNGLGVLISKSFKGEQAHEAGKGIFRIHCVAHRLNLCARHLVDETPELQDFENDIKALATFFNNQHPKNLAALTGIALNYEVRARRITYTFTTRWTNSEHLVLARLRDTMPVLITTLEAIASPSSTFHSDVKSTARGINDKIRKKEFVIMVYFMSDIISVLSSYSELFQKSGGLVIGLDSIRNSLINALEALKDGTRKYVATLVAALECQKSISSTTFRPCNNIPTVLASLNVRFKATGKMSDIPLNAPATTTRSTTATAQGETPRFRPYCELVEHVVDSLKSTIEKYFPEGILGDFEVLHPKNFKKDKINMRNQVFGNVEIARLASRFQLDSTLVTTEWAAFCKNFAENEEFDVVVGKHRSGQTLWPYLLRWKGVIMGENLRKLIRICLTLAASSADAERAFSVMNVIKTSRRNSLGVGTLQSLMRIHRNGPNELPSFPFYKYGKEWGGRHAAGGGLRPGKRPSTSKPESCVPKRIFGQEAGQVEAEDLAQAVHEESHRTNVDADDEFVFGAGPEYVIPVEDNDGLLNEPDLYRA